MGLLARQPTSGADYEQVDRGAAFAAPAKVRKAEARLERGNWLRRGAGPRIRDHEEIEPNVRPTVLQRRRLAERLSSAAEV